MNKKKNINIILGALAVTSVSASSVTTSLANNNELFVKTNEASKSSDKYTINWTEKLGAEKEDKFYKVIPTSDKGFLAIGESALTETTGFSTGDAIIVKYDSKGDEVWRDILQGDESDRYYSVVELKDGGFVAFGTSYSTDLEFENPNRVGNAIAVLYDATGARLGLYSYNYGGKALVYKDAVVLSDGSILAVCGEIKANIGGDAIEKDSIITYSIHSININRNKTLSHKKFNSPKLNQRVVGTEMIIGDMITTSDKHVLVSGYEYVTGTDASEFTHFLMKMDEAGEEVWVTEETCASPLITNSIFESKNGSIYVAGETNSFADVPTSDAILMKFDSETGEGNWSTLINGANYDSFNAVSVDDNGDIVVIGHSNSPIANTNIAGDKTEIIIAKYNEQHASMLDIVSLGADTQGIVVNSAFQDENGNLIIAGKQGFVTGNDACDLINPCTQFDAVLLSVEERLTATPNNPDIPETCTATTVTLTKNEVTLNIGDRLNIKEYLSFGTGITIDDVEISTNPEMSKDDKGYYANKAGNYEISVKYDNGCGNEKTLVLKVVVKDPSCPVNPPSIAAKDEYTYYIGDDFDVMKLITFTGLDTAKIKTSNIETIDGKTVTTVEYESGDKIVVTSNVNFQKEGSYSVGYTLTNACGEAQKEVKVHVKAKNVVNNGTSNETNNGGSNTSKPQTGDNALVYVGAAGVSIVGLIALNSNKLKKDSDKNDGLEN